MISKLLGPAGLSYIQTVHTERERLQNRWSLTLDRVGERVQIGGVEHIKNLGRGAELTIQTDVVVQVPVIRRQVEAGVKREIERVFERRRMLMEELTSPS